ncbi:hypothetical protein ACFQ2B_36270 [Streptomyces stramineus]
MMRIPAVQVSFTLTSATPQRSRKTLRQSPMMWSSSVPIAG